MWPVTFIAVISFLNIANSHESDSAEGNRIEFSPYYDTIIFRDVIDIMNELNKHVTSPLDEFASSEESDENVEDLLTEYQHYLDKAQEQRRIHLEKSNKTKNKVPLLRHENYARKKLPTGSKYTNYYDRNNYYNPSLMKFVPSVLNNPYDFFVPINPSMSHINNIDLSRMTQNKDFILTEDNKPIDVSALKYPHKPVTEQISSCYCKPGLIPCKCNCKQCLVPMGPAGLYDKNYKAVLPSADKKHLSLQPTLLESKVADHLLADIDNAANTLNVRIKVDVQLPRFLDSAGKNIPINNRESNLENDEFSRDLPSNIKIPSTYFNFPIPIDVFGYKKKSKINRHDPSLHKISIHKKKKFRYNNNNIKKHRKKLITYNNVQLYPSQTSTPMVGDENHINSGSDKLFIELSNKTSTTNYSTVSTEYNLMNFTSTTAPKLSIITPIEENILLMVNISNSNDNEMNDTNKTGNSIELDYKTVSNTTQIPTGIPLRKKRDINVIKYEGIDIINQNTMKPMYYQISSKKTERSRIPERELLHWPSNLQNQTLHEVKNITDIIVDRENKKAKLNMTTDALRQNHTLALEQAIFGSVDWNDVDTVAPTFISFIGKYINGILTFCSDKICHSMKCANKTCIHRTCAPLDRFNHAGHCYGSNETDSVVTIESIMDLPSNIAFEIVDILQDKMLGKLYGKVTLCISSKCISFITSKKTFVKQKCTAKSLTESGHCPNKNKS